MDKRNSKKIIWLMIGMALLGAFFIGNEMLSNYFSSNKIKSDFGFEIEIPVGWHVMNIDDERISSDEVIFIVKNNNESDEDIYKKLNFANDDNLIIITVTDVSVNYTEFAKEKRNGKIIVLDNNVKTQYINFADGNVRIFTLPIKNEKMLANGKIARSITISSTTTSSMNEKEFIKWIQHSMQYK